MEPDHTSQIFQLPDGRTLGYAFYGSSSPTAHQVLYIHSFPSSRLEAAILASHALALNIRLIAPDRPGIGLSSPLPKRNITSYPTDILALLNHLQVQRFAITAYSAGMPYALACVKAIPRERLLGVEIAAGAFPAKVGSGQAFFNIMFKPVQQAMNSGLSHLFASSINSQFGALARASDPTAFYDACEKEMKLRPEIERKALEGVEKLVLWDPLREALRGDKEGKGKEMGNELKLQAEEWGVGLDRGGWGGVTLWHGDMDANCPLANLRLAAGKMGSELKVLEGQGHVGVLVYFGRAILEHALERMK